MPISLPAIIHLVGTDRFFWNSDYPHAEVQPGVKDDLEQMGTQLSPEAKANLFGLNAARLYNITGRRGGAHAQ